MENRGKQNLLYKELSYQVQGAAIEVRKNFGPGHKESIYQSAFAEELSSRDIKFSRESSIKICSPKTGKAVGYYRPDFLIDDKIIVELKAQEKFGKANIDQLYDYLRNSEYELGYFINFSSPKLYMKRIIYTNDRKFSKPKNLLVVLSFIFVVFSVLPRVASAATFSFNVASQETHVGEIMPLEIMLNTQGERVNAIELAAKYTTDDFKFIDWSTGNSVVNFFIQKPKDENGEIFFSGIIPGGFNGREGLIVTLNFEALKEGSSEFSFAKGASALVDDARPAKTLGLADNLEIKINETIIPASPTSTLDSKFQILDSKSDTSPPEHFKPELGRDPSIFGGSWFIAFATTDKGSGVDAYYVYEFKDKINPENIKYWAPAESPYLLKDQKLVGYVYIKAVDKALNERVVSFKLKSNSKLKYAKYGAFGIIITILIIISRFLLRLRKARKLLKPVFKVGISSFIKADAQTDVQATAQPVVQPEADGEESSLHVGIQRVNSSKKIVRSSAKKTEKVAPKEVGSKSGKIEPKPVATKKASTQNQPPKLQKNKPDATKTDLITQVSVKPPTPPMPDLSKSTAKQRNQSIKLKNAKTNEDKKIIIKTNVKDL